MHLSSFQIKCNVFQIKCCINSNNFLSACYSPLASFWSVQRAVAMFLGASSLLSLILSFYNAVFKFHLTSLFFFFPWNPYSSLASFAKESAILCRSSNIQTSLWCQEKHTEIKKRHCKDLGTDNLVNMLLQIHLKQFETIIFNSWHNGRDVFMN